LWDGKGVEKKGKKRPKQGKREKRVVSGEGRERREWGGKGPDL